MTLRNAVLGLAVMFGLGVWSWCRESSPPAKASGAEIMHPAGEAGVGRGGTRDEALARYRSNGSRHWRQMAIGGTIPR